LKKGSSDHVYKYELVYWIKWIVYESKSCEIGMESGKVL